MSEPQNSEPQSQPKHVHVFDSGICWIETPEKAMKLYCICGVAKEFPQPVEEK